MNIHSYLSQTMNLIGDYEPSQEDKRIGILLDFLQRDQYARIQVVHVASHDFSHSAVELDGFQYLIWDKSLASLCHSIVKAFSVWLHSRQGGDSPEALSSQNIAINHARKLFAHALSRRLKQNYPFVAAALWASFYKVAEMGASLKKYFPTEYRLVSAYHEMIMFYHEAAHFAMYRDGKKHPLRERAVKLLAYTGNHGNPKDEKVIHLKQAMASEAFDHYLDEVTCDSLAVHNALLAGSLRWYPMKLSVEEVAFFVYLSNHILGLIERYLRFCVLFWDAIGENTSDGTDGLLEVETFQDYEKEHPLLFIRYWSTMLGMMVAEEYLGIHHKEIIRPEVDSLFLLAQEKGYGGYVSFHNFCYECFALLETRPFAQEILNDVRRLRAFGVSENEARSRVTDQISWES